MPRYYDSQTVNGTANVEVLADLLTSTQNERKTIRRLWISEVTGTLQNNARIRVYRERERIIDMPYQQLLTKSGAGDSPSMRVIEIELDVPVGQTVQVGQVSGATASNLVFTAEYEINRAAGA